MSRSIACPTSERDGVLGKSCRVCGAWKTLTNYARNATSHLGRRNICSTCEGRVANADPAQRRRRIEAVRRYQKRHPLKFKTWHAAASARRYKREKAGVGVTPEQVAALLQQHDGKCAYCKCVEADTLDHVVPLARGGAHEIGNLLPACFDCNRRKHARTPEEWRAACKELVQ